MSWCLRLDLIAEKIRKQQFFFATMLSAIGIFCDFILIVLFYFMYFGLEVVIQDFKSSWHENMRVQLAK